MRRVNLFIHESMIVMTQDRLMYLSVGSALRKVSDMLRFNLNYKTRIYIEDNVASQVKVDLIRVGQ